MNRPQATPLPHRPHSSGLGAFLAGLIDRAVLVVSVLAAGAVPSFIAQYRQRIGGMLAQAETDLSPFIEIARRYHGGSLDALIAHHHASSDATFRDEGHAIAALRDAAEYLRQSYAALDTELAGQVIHLLRHGDPVIARATWEVYQPAFSFTPEALVFALVAGVLVWILFALCWGLVVRLFHPRH